MEDSPAFVCQKQERVFVQLYGADLPPGVRQYGDDYGLSGAIKLTDWLGGEFHDVSSLPGFSFASGERISVVKKGRQISLLHDGWIPSGQRIALGIPLHPDQMVREDWVALPGIGEVLADRIENDRQENGDFGSLEGLRRVKGIGKKSIEKLRPFF